MGSLIMSEDKIKKEQPFIASCVDAGDSRVACRQVLDDMVSVHTYLNQGKQYLGGGKEADEFEEEVKEVIKMIDQISNRLRRTEDKNSAPTTSDSIL